MDAKVARKRAEDQAREAAHEADELAKKLKARSMEAEELQNSLEYASLASLLRVLFSRRGLYFFCVSCVVR